MSLNATQKMVRNGRMFSIINLNHKNERASKRSGGNSLHYSEEDTVS